MIFGSAEHAASVTTGRHPAIQDGLQWLTFAHLPGTLQRFSEVFYIAAVSILARVTTDSPELTTSINRLIEAKDSAVRAGIRHSTGRAGSIPRPQAVVDLPQLNESAVCSHGVRHDMSPQDFASAHVSGYCGDPQ